MRLKSEEPSLQNDLQEQYGAQIVERFDFGHRLTQGEGELVRMALPEELSVKEAVKLFSQEESVAYAEPNFRYYPDGAVEDSKPNDLNYRLWGLDNQGRDFGKRGADISAREAWGINKGDRKNGPVVAVIDTGVDVTHPDLVDNLWVNTGEIPGDGIDNDGNGVVDDVHGYNAFHDNNDLSDVMVHGTHVAGTVGAVGNNGLGITGVAQEAQLMTIRIFGESGHTNEATVLRGLAYADKMGARITTNSWGGIHSQAMEEAFASSPALHFASAGNSGRDNDVKPHFPGSYDMDNMVAVAATTNKDKLGGFSCYGAESVDLAAPGQKIYSTMPGHRYKHFSGTSMATPHVTGAASLILSEYPDLTNEEVKARLLNGTDALPELEGKMVSGGRLNAASSLEADTVPPAPFTGLQAEATATGVQLTWLATGDDGKEGLARHQELRSSGSPITPSTFAEAQAHPAPAPQAAGVEQTFEQSLPLSKVERRLHYALRATDNVGLTTPLAQTQVVVPAAHVAFEDSPSVSWQTEGTWARDSQGVWTDSPDGDYEYDEESSIVSPRFSLKEGSGHILRFDYKGALKRGDVLRVEVSTDGEKWNTRELFEGEQEWQTQEVSLKKYEGQDVQLRFRLNTDQWTNGDGVYLKGIEVLGSPG